MNAKTLKAMSPKAIIKSYGIDYDNVVRAINFRYKKNWLGGLCFTFSANDTEHRSFGAYDTIPVLLADLNNRTDLLRNYWDHNENGFAFSYEDKGNEERLMLLAFMLTWLDD